MPSTTILIAAAAVVVVIIILLAVVLLRGKGEAALPAPAKAPEEPPAPAEPEAMPAPPLDLFPPPEPVEFAPPPDEAPVPSKPIVLPEPKALDLKPVHAPPPDGELDLVPIGTPEAERAPAVAVAKPVEAVAVPVVEAKAEKVAEPTAAERASAAEVSVEAAEETDDEVAAALAAEAEAVAAKAMEEAAPAPEPAKEPELAKPVEEPKVEAPAEAPVRPAPARKAQPLAQAVSSLMAKPAVAAKPKAEPEPEKASTEEPEAHATPTVRPSAAEAGEVTTPKPESVRPVRAQPPVEVEAPRHEEKPARPKGSLADRIAKVVPELKDEAPAKAEPAAREPTKPARVKEPAPERVVKAAPEPARGAAVQQVPAAAKEAPAPAVDTSGLSPEEAAAARRKAVLERMYARVAAASQTAALEEKDPRHKDARRLARLFASEIILYNPEAVEQGRKQGHLYRLLKKDVDRCRDVIKSRVPPEVLNEFDYLYDEMLIQIAQGDETKFGPEMPPPKPPRKKTM